MKRKLTIARLPTSERESKSGGSKAIAADPFFYTPYEPGQPSEMLKQDAASTPVKPSLNSKKPVLGALLGGIKK